MGADQLALIKTVSGYGKTEAKRIDVKRHVTRVGEKKATAVRLTVEQANQLKQQPNTPQGRRDALLLCLLLDHGLRVGEVALLQAENFDRSTGQFHFERPKVDGIQTHKLTADTLRAFYAWVNAGECPEKGPLLRESLKNGELTEPGMSERAIKARVRLLGERIGVAGLSPHDCRHFWATYWAEKVNILRLQEAGGWASLEMPRRYVERAKVANEGMA
jgi:integrase